MASRTPSIERTCLVCNATFEGTPKATRCPKCKAEGLRVPAKPRRTCGDCRKQFILTDPSHFTCEPCAVAFGIDQTELSPERLAEIRAEEIKARWRDAQDHLNAWLNARDRKPKGYPKMLAHTAITPIGILWLEVCTADGAAAAAMYCNSHLTEAEKVLLLTTYFRFRAKGYQPRAIAKLCPVSLLTEQAQDALGDIPKVTQSEPEVKDLHQQRSADAQRLGLVPFNEREPQ